MPLGTREVDDYEFPSWLYDKILYVEKKGLWPVLKAVMLAERFDMAVVAAEGYATEATRTLFEHAHKGQDYQLFVLHDADPHGYNIARTLREETARMPGYSVDVVDLGLKLEEALGMDLAVEEFTRSRTLPLGLKPELGEVERQYFEGRQVGQKSWICRRVELNAMTAPQLVEYIERKLEEAGVRGKVIPSEEELPGLTEEAARAQAGLWVKAALEEMLSVTLIKESIAEEFLKTLQIEEAEGWIKQGFGEDVSASWRAVMAEKLSLREHHADTLNGSLRRLVVDAVEGERL